MIDGVIFDKDGTLFDFRQSWAGFAATMLAEVARDADHAAELGARVGFDPETGAFATDSLMIAGTTAEIAAKLLPLLPDMTQDDLAERLSALSLGAQMHPAVHLLRVLGELRDRGLRIGLATNDNEAPARAHLSAAGIDHLFDFIAGCDSGYGAKPEPGMLLAFTHLFGLDPGRVVMVGDSRHDLVAGQDAGMWTIGVLTGIADRAELAPFADAVLPTIGNLAAWIDGLADT